MYKLLNIDELAEMLGVTKATIYSWTSQNKIPHIKLSKRLLKFREDEILKWIEDRSVRQGPEVQERKRMKKFQRLNDDRVKEIVETAKREVLV